jgi:hypothetical protein
MSDSERPTIPVPQFAGHRPCQFVAGKSLGCPEQAEEGSLYCKRHRPTLTMPSVQLNALRDAARGMSA